jgi:hypothetical protein
MDNLAEISSEFVMFIYGLFNPLTPELNPSTQRCLKRYFTGNFAS